MLGAVIVEKDILLYSIGPNARGFPPSRYGRASLWGGGGSVMSGVGDGDERN